MPIDEEQLVAQYPRGFNGSISYSLNGAGSQTYVRIRKIAHSWQVIATESHARVARAMYPHQRAISRFALTLEMKGYREYEGFMGFMQSYIDALFGTEKKSVYVMSAVRGFNRWGIPIKGIAIGDHVGSMVFSPTITFESINDPLDQQVMTPEAGAVSATDLNGVSGDAASFFFPWSQASRDPNARAETFYDFGQTPSLSGAVGGAVSGTIGSAAQRAQDIIDDMRRNGQL
jgi:hypothetical protein